MSKWEEKKFGSFISLKRGYDLPLTKSIDGEFPVIASTGLRGTHNEYKVVSPVMTLGRSGSIGKVQLIRENSWPLNTTLYVKDFKNNNVSFVYYFLKTIDFERFNAGAGVPTLNRNHLKSLKIRVPDLKTQEKIADVLSTYDELIENNNRRIEILEKSAEEIYKEWFVRMRFPGYENTKFGKGIPEGWEVRKLSEIFDIADGTHDTPKKVSIGIPLVTGKNIVNGSIDFDSTYNISIEDFEKINVRSAIYKNDILYSNIGTIGTMTIINDDNKYSVKNLIILKTNEYKFYEYIYLLFKSKSSQDFFESVASGASQKFISLTEMRKYKILLPCSKLLVEFKANIKDLFEEIKILKEQNQNLIKQRDLLLPRLMNGAIEVK